MPVRFDSSDPLALEPDIEWAVVHDPYAAFRKEPSYSVEVISHCRQGAVIRVIGSQTVNDENEKNGHWFAFEEGWLPASAVDVYSNKLKAETAAAVFEKK